MIFKTFDSDIDNMSSRWGMFGKSFSDIGDTITTKWKQVTDYVAVTNDATISGMMSAWKGTSPVQFLSDDSVVNVLNNYNKALDKGAEATAKFFEAGTGNDFMNGWLKQLKGAPATMDDYKAAVAKAELAQNGLTASMVASKVAALALNVAISIGASVAISALIKLVDNLVHANEKAIEKAEELRDKYNDFKETNASNVKILNDLKDEFEELSDGVSQYGDNISLTTEQYARYQEIVQQIVGISPSLAEGYDTENGYIADKNGLLERAIELQEIEYRNELRKITNLDNLKTSMSGYIAEYKEALNGGYVTSEGNIIGTTIDTDFKNSLWQVFNTNNRDNYDGQSMARDIMESLGVKDIDKEIKKYINEYGYWQDSDFWNDYCDKIVNNLEVVTNSLTAEEVGLDDTIFDQNIEKLESYAEQYNDMKDSVKSANESIQTDLGYIAEYADGYSDLSKEQQKFVTDYLKGFDISDITSENSMGILEYDEDKMASVKSQIKKFVEELSHDDSTKQALTDLYAPPSDNETIEEYKNRIDSALKAICKYCEANGIEIPVGISDVEDSATGLEDSYKQTIENAKEKYGEDLTPFFKENSINTQEEIDKWREIAQSCDTATEAKKKYLETQTSNETPISLLSISETVDAVNTKLKPALDSLKTVYQSIFSSDGFTLDDVDVSMLESLKKSFEDLKENGIDIATEDFENFTRVITDSSTTSDEAQRAFNKLATTLVNNSKVTLVSDDAFNTLVQTLEQLGITNAEEALQGLRDIQSEIASKGYDLANITNEQAAAFINEGNASAEAVTYLQYYMIQKQLAEQPLSTVGDVESLENLCNTLGVTGEMLQEVINLKNMMNAVNAGAPTAEFMPRIEESKKKIAELAKGEFEYKFDFKPKLDSSKASGSAKDIAEEFKNLLDAELKVLDTKMDAGLINFNDYIAQRLALIQKYYDEGKIKASDYYDYLSKHYETQLSYMDKVTSYVTTRIDKEIDSYNKQIDQIKEKYQTEIDYLDTVIDYYEKQKEALQDANTQRELQLALQKALYDLEKAQTQRSRKIYADNHGYIYRADGDAIRDAQDNLNKAKLDIQINEIDKAIKKVQEQQDALKKAMDKEVEAINKIIENLEAYKEKWSSIAKEYEEKQNEMIAQQMLGADIEKEILAGRLDVLEDFKNKYLAIQQAIKDANANAAQAALNEANKPSTTGGSGSGSGNGTKVTTTPKSPLVSDAEKKRIQEKNKKKKQRLTGGGTKKLVAKYANGTKNAEPGYHEIAENGDELIRDNYGNAYIAKGHQLHNFEGGETVYDAGDTKELLGGRLVPIESMPGISESLKNLMAYANTPDASQLRIQPNIPDYNMLKNVDSKSSTNNQVYVTQNVNVTLPNVTNEAGFNNFKKELDRLKLDAYQFANKRNK